MTAISFAVVAFLIVLSGGGGYFLGRRAGRVSERAKGLEDSVEHARKSHEIDESVHRLDDDELDERLRDGGL